MKKHPMLAALFLLLTAVFLNNCHKELYEWDRLSKEIQLEPTLLAPLVYGEVGMNDIIELFDSVDYVGTFPDSLIYVAFTDTLLSVSADTVFALLDTMDTEVFYLESDEDVILPGNPGDTSSIPILRTESLVIETEGDHRLYEVLISQGITGILVTSTFHHEGILTITSDDFLDPSMNPIRITIPIDDASGNFETLEELDNSGYTLRPDYEEGVHEIEFNFELQIINSGQPILQGEFCAIQFSLWDVEFEHLYGFIDSEDLLDESGSLEISIWEDNPDLAAITLGDPRIEIILATSAGIPLEIDLDSFIAVGPGDDVPLILDGGNTLFFPAPSFDNQGSTVVSNHEISKETSNIVDFLAATPSSIYYSLDGRTALMGDDTMHFVLGDSKVDLSTELVIPLDFKSTGYALSNIQEFEIGEDRVDTSMVRNVEVSIQTVNELPIELMLQAYLLDEDQQPIDSIFDDSRPVLAASVVDGEGKLVTASEESNTVEFPIEKLAKLEEVRYLEFRAVMTTSNQGNQFVKIYAPYTLDFKISMLADLILNSQNL